VFSLQVSSRPAPLLPDRDRCVALRSCHIRATSMAGNFSPWPTCTSPIRLVRGSADEAPEGQGDDPIPVPGLVHHRSADAGATEPGHQLFQARTGSGI
jgi:hypothetical protein